jgi:polyisoprenoid-binding protein YceI
MERREVAWISTGASYTGRSSGRGLAALGVRWARNSAAYLFTTAHPSRLRPARRALTSTVIATHAKESSIMTAPTSDIRFAGQDPSAVPVGNWLVDPVRSHASFTARAAGRSVRGCLPLTGAVSVAASFEDSTAHLTAMADEVSAGNRMLDRLLAGPGFLDTEVYPTISLRSQMLVCVPTGWRAVGQLQVKGIEHPIVCELEADLRPKHPQAGVAAMTLTTRWVLDSTWITTQRVPTLSRRIAMNCSVVLDRAPEATASEQPAA